MDFSIITNNPRVRDAYGTKYALVYRECSFDELLLEVRDRIHQGYRLLTHPLSGSVKPNETPYKSVLLAAEKSDVDSDSVMLIENAVTVAMSPKFDKYRERQKILNERILADFQMIDYFLITGAIESAVTGLF